MRDYDAAFLRFFYSFDDTAARATAYLRLLRNAKARTF
jgi:hypothetical protein